MPLTAKQKRLIRKNRSKSSPKKLAQQTGAKINEVTEFIESLSPKPDPKREKLFRLIALSLPILFFLFLEGGLRLCDYAGDLSLFISAPGEYSDYYMCNPDVGKRYFFMQSTVPDPPNDLFLKEKPENSYRMFVIGGSTTAGYPYGNNILFSRILQYRLSDVFPEKQIEVINTAMTAVNTYTLLDFLDEILQYEPDALLIYAGHNEFYGALGAASNESLGKIQAFVKLYLKLQKFKTFLLLRNVLGKIKNWIDKVFYEGNINDPTATLMERMVGEQTIPYGGAIYELGKKQFENNLRNILTKAKAAGLEVLISELVSNVRGIKPFVSVKADTLPVAAEVYRRAQKLDALGQFKEARRVYLQAKDLDGLRFRAAEEFNDIIHKVAGDLETPVVPMRAYFEQASPNGIIGDELMLEHLHPNARGYFLMADAFFNEMHKHGFIKPRWEPYKIRPAGDYRAKWGYTDLDEAYADIRIRILKGNWPFKPKNVRNRALIDYKPSTKPESLAVDIWLKKDLNLERGHVQLAEYYEKTGSLEKAFAEYKALIFATPFNASPYLGAAKVLVKMPDFERALPYLKKSLQFRDTAYANKWIGQIYLNNGKTRQALPFLEKAAEMSPKDPQVIYNLSGAYALDKQYDLSRTTLKKLEQIAPNFPGADDLRRQLEQL